MLLNPTTVFMHKQSGRNFIKIASFIIESDHQHAIMKQFDPPESKQFYEPSFGADMWALGVFIFYLNTGKYPFGTTATKIVSNRNKIMYDRSWLDPILIPIVSQLLQPE